MTTVRHNAEKNGVEIAFPGKPDEAVRRHLKACGFKWSPFGKVWYRKLTSDSWATAHRIAGIEPAPMPTTAQPKEDSGAAAYVKAQFEAYEQNITDLIGR